MAGIVYFFHVSHSFSHFPIQNIKTELEVVREDLSVAQKDKFMLQAKVSELKNSMKSLLQQNQQLKMDLKHGKMKKVFEQKDYVVMPLDYSTGEYSAARKLGENS
mgnify:CR=1 FL=1